MVQKNRSQVESDQFKEKTHEQEDNVTENFETEESHDVWSQAESGRVQCCFKPSGCVIL